MPTSPANRSPRRAVALSLVAALATGGPATARAQEAAPRAPLAVSDEPAELAWTQGLAEDARELARAGRYAAAAIRLEAALAATGDVRLRYHAGVARSLAGHHALAWRHFTETQAQPGVNLSDAARRHLQARIDAELALTAPVRLQLVRGASGPPIDPAWLSDAQITLRSASAPPDSQVMFTVTGWFGQELRLDPGPWIVQVRMRGHRPAELFGTVIPGTETTWRIAVAPEQIAVELHFSPPSALRGAHVKLTSIGDPTPRVIERELDRASLTMMLTVGTWQIDVTSRRREAHTQIMIAPGQGVFSIELRKPERGGGGSRRFEGNDKLSAGLGIVLAAELTAAAGLALAGGVITGRALNRNERLLMSALVDDATGDADGKPGLDQVQASYPTARFHADLNRGLNLETAGFVTFAGAVALLLPAATAASRSRYRAAYAEMGLGAALLAGGAVWMAAYLDRRDRVLASGDPLDRLTGPDLRALTGHNIGASMLTGLGIGLLVFPAVTLLADRRIKRRYGSASLSPWTAPGQAGLSLRGRF